MCVADAGVGLPDGAGYDAALSAFLFSVFHPESSGQFNVYMGDVVSASDAVYGAA